MLNLLSGTYGTLIKFGIVLALLGGLYGVHKYKVNEAVKDGVHAIQIQHQAELFKQKELLFEKKREVDTKLQDDFNKRRSEQDARIKNLTTDRDNLLASLRNRPERPAVSSGDSASANTTESTRGAYPSELFREDAAAFVNFARDTEEIRLGLIQCYSDYESVKLSVESFNRK